MNTPPIKPITRHAAKRGFTLIELMVVVIIISASIATVVPLIGALTRSSRVEAGINTISAAINAARILSHRNKETDKGTGGWPPYPIKADYSGTAVIFCPGGDIRFVINDQKAYTGTGTPGSVAPGGANDPKFIENFVTKTNGYKDIDGVDYARLPNASGVVGVVRTGSAVGAVTFLAPPFAVRFNERGQAASDQQVIYYDSDYDTIYDHVTGSVTLSRPANYNPGNWLPKKGSVYATLDTSAKRYTLPFEEIETVSAIVLYDEHKFTIDGLVWGTSTSADIATWMQANGRALYFSPYTGLVISESLQ